MIGVLTIKGKQDLVNEIKSFEEVNADCMGIAYRFQDKLYQYR